MSFLNNSYKTLLRQFLKQLVQQFCRKCLHFQQFCENVSSSSNCATFPAIVPSRITCVRKFLLGISGKLLKTFQKKKTQGIAKENPEEIPVGISEGFHGGIPDRIRDEMLVGIMEEVRKEYVPR